MNRLNEAKTQRGFTLIELMIVIAIVAILAGIGYPAYQNQIKKSKRADAHASLLSFAAAMERFYTVNGTYGGAGVGGIKTGVPDTSVFPQYSPTNTGSADSDYQLVIQAADDDSYILSAQARNFMDGEGNIQLWSTGRKRQQVNGKWQDEWE